jgi:hypothetical protein
MIRRVRSCTRIRSMNVLGGFESSTKVIGAEQAETLAIVSVAVALNVVCESSGTCTSIPGEAREAADADGYGGPEQSAFGYTLTVVPAGALPWTKK